MPLRHHAVLPLALPVLSFSSSGSSCLLGVVSPKAADDAAEGSVSSSMVSDQHGELMHVAGIAGLWRLTRPVGRKPRLLRQQPHSHRME